jgi:hypothetical protein
MQDFIVDQENDIVITNSDFLIADSDAQHLQHLMEAVELNYKHDPEIGANVRSALNGSGTQQDLIAKIKRQFEKDGYSEIDVKLSGNTIEISKDGIL